jgi:filamentous hemagglutinin family protein
MFKLRALTAWWALGWGLATPLATPVLAQPITVDARVAGPQPVVGVSSNGVPVVDIAPPGAGGVSNNAFTHFNVGPAGVVLNNSVSASPTQLAGQINGNPMLGNQPAATILNQVTAPNPSQLLGTLEVAGQRANVIVANPAGITCNGCGFLNASRATLTTGRPQVGPDGRISFDVASGTILIDGAGLNAAGAAHQANLSRVDLLARAIKINAGIWADHLKLVTGANQLDYGSEQVTAKASHRDNPAFALDTAALGSMYANSIRLIGTEQGLGVHLRGSLTALTGEIRVNAAGEVRIAPTAALKAGGDLVIDASPMPGSYGYNQPIHNEGSLLAGVSAATDVPIAGQGSITLKSTTITNPGTIAAGKDATLIGNLHGVGGKLSAMGKLDLKGSGYIKISGGRVSGGTVELGHSVDNVGGELTALGNLTIERGIAASETGYLNNQEGKISVGGDFIAPYVHKFNNSQGRISAGGTIKVEAHQFDNHDGIIVGKMVGVKTREFYKTRYGVVQDLLSNIGGLIRAEEALTLDAWVLDNRHTQTSDPSRPLGLVGKTVTINTGNDASNKHQDRRLKNFNNTQGSVAAEKGLKLTTRMLVNHSGRVFSLGPADIKAEYVHNEPAPSSEAPGQIGAGDRLSMETRRIGGGTLRSEGDLFLTVQNPYQREGLINVSKIFAGRDLTVNARDLDNTAQGELVARGVTKLNIERTLRNEGKLEAGSLRIRATEATFATNTQGPIQADQDIDISVAGPVLLGGVVAGNDISVSATTLTNEGWVQAGNDVSLTATGPLTLQNTGRLLAGVGQVGAPMSGEEMPIPVAGQGSIRLKAPVIKTLGPPLWPHSARAGKAITLMADQLALSGAPLTTPGTVVLHTPGDLDIGQETLQRALQGTSWEIHARNLSNKDNHLTVKGDFTAQLSGLFNNTGGTLAAGERLTIVQSSPGAATEQGTGLPSLNNYHGQIAAPRVVIKLPQVDNPGGQILGDQVSIEAARLTNRAGSPGGVIAARQALNLGVKELENGAHALLYSQGDLSIGGALDANNQAVGVAQTISNTGGIIDAHGKVVAQARTITNGQGATVLAGHTVLWPKEALTNDAGSQVITGDFLLDTDRFTNTGRLEARTIAMTVNHFDNVGKLVRADQHLQLQGKGPESTLDNRQGLLMSAGSLAIKFDRFDNTQGTVLAAGDADVHIGQMLGSGRWILGGKLDLKSPGSWTQGPDALVDAGHLDLRIGSLYNQGVVYGDTVSLEAQEIHNQGGVIAARSRLELGVATLTNHAQGWIASADSFTLGGALDGAGRAVGQAQRVQNRGATLESLGYFTLTAVQLANENARLETAQVTVAGPASHFSIQPKGESERIDASRLIEIKVGNKDRYAIYPSATAPPFSYTQLRSWVAQALEGRFSREQDKYFHQALQTIEASLAAKQPVTRYFLTRLAEPLGQLSRYPELQKASLTSRQVQRQAELFVAGQVDALGQDPVFLHKVDEGIGAALFSWVRGKREVPQQEPDAVRYAPLLEEARHYAVWKGAVQSGLFKAETGGAIALLKAWRVLENQPLFDKDPRRSPFWGNAAAVKGPVLPLLPLLPRLTQFGYLKPEQAQAAQPYYAAQILATPRWAKEWREFETERRVTQTQVTHSEPGQVLAGANLNLAIGQQGLNSNSHVLAGGKLTYTGQDLTLESAKSERLLQETGRTRQAYLKGGGGWFGPGERLKRTAWQAYEPGPVVLSSSPIAQVAEKTDVPHSSRTIAARRLEAALPAQAQAPQGDPVYRVTNWTQADGAQVRQLDGIAVPHSVLYRATPAGSPSLYQTEPAFLNGETQPGLGTLLQALDRPSSVAPLGDGFMESRLVRDQAMALTGQRFLPGFDNDQRAYRALLSQTAVLAYQGQWPVGEYLSTSVIQALPHSVVWPVRQEVIGPDGKPVQALMPTLYLRERSPAVVSAASQVSAPDILVQLAGKLDQDGRVQAQRGLNLQAQDLTLRGELMGQTVSTHSKGDTQILGGQLTGEKALGVTAEGAVTIASTVHHTVDRTQLERIATLTTTEPGAPIDVQSQGDTRIDAGQLQSAGDISVKSQGHVQFTAQTERWQETITFGRKNVLHQAREEDLGSALNAQRAIYVEAGGDIAGRAVNLVAQNDLSLRAQGAITFEAGQIHTTLDDQWYSRDRGFLSSSESTFKLHEDARRSQPSTITGESVQMWAGGDLRITGSNVGAQRDLTLEAQQQVAITPAIDTVQAWVYEQTKQSGFGALGGLSYGQRKQTDRGQSQRTEVAPSMVGSVEGDVRIHAGEVLAVVGSQVLAPAGDVTLSGQAVTIDAAHNTLHEQASHEIKESGLTVTANTPVINALQVGQRMERAVGQLGGAADNPVMTALAGVTTGLAAKNAYDAVMKDPQHLGGASVVLSVGSSESRSDTERASSWVQGSTLMAGQDLTVLAQGAGQDSDLTVTGSTLSAGQNMVLEAEGDLLLQAAQNHAEQRTKSQSSSTSIGLGVSLGARTGITAELGASAARGNTDGQDSVWTNSQVTAGQALVLNAGSDMTLKGAQGYGERIVAAVGGNLVLESLQDTHTYRGKQDSQGFSASLCIPPFCTGVGPTAGNSIAGNIGRGKMKSDFCSVNEQSWLWAGDGGFEIDVKDHTRLIGAVIASSDQAVANGRNQLATGTLSVEDIENKAHYSASQVSLGAGFSWGGQTSDLGTTQDGQVAGGASKEHGSSIPTSKDGLGVGMPMVAAASGESHSTTQSAVSGATIAIRDEAAQQDLTGMTPAETIASLNRDTAHTENALKPIFEKEKIEAGFEIVTALQQQAGQFLTNRAQEIDALKARGQDPALTQAERDQVTAAAMKLEGQWGPSGAYRRVLSALSAGAAGDVTGSSGALMQAAAVNYLQQQGASTIGELVKQGSLREGSPLHASLHAIVGCAGAAASSQSCGAGAMGAAASSLLTHLFAPAGPDETAQEREAKQQLITSLVASVASTLGTGSDAVAATTSASVAAQNNWLASEQIAQAKQELAACTNSVCTAQTIAKWAATSVMQDGLTVGGLGKGLAQAGWNDLQSLAQFLSDPVVGLQGLAALVNSAELRAQLGQAVVESLNKKIGEIQTALQVGGNDQALRLGENIGELTWHVGSAVAAVGGTAKAGVELAKVGIKAGGKVLDQMAERGAALNKAHWARDAAKAESLAVKEGVKSLPIVIEPQIAQQLTQRGWSEQGINGVIAYPTKTVVTRDARWDPVSGTHINDPATGYIARDGAYVVRNDRTGVIVEVSDRNSHNGIAFWRNGKDGIATFETAGVKTGATIEKSALQKALAAAKPTSGHPTQLMTTLEDGTRVIFRKDFGEQAHTIGGPFQGMGKIDHYNIEIQSAAGKRIENVHAVPDESGGFTFWGKDGIIK